MIWPAFVIIKDNELISSWFIRLAYAHNLDIEFFKYFWTHFDLEDVDLCISEFAINQIALYTTVSEALIRNASFEYYYNEYLKWLLPVKDINRTKNRFGLMVCPNCLENDGDTPYHRKLWRMGFAFLCLECQCYLIDRCPSCKSPLSVFNHKVMARSEDMVLPLNLCFSCRFDLRKSILIYPKSQWIDLQYKINCIVDSNIVTCGSIYGEDNLYTLSNVLGRRGIASDELTRAIADELNMHILPRNWKDVKGFANMGIERRRYYLMISDWLLSDFQSKIRYITSHHKIHIGEEILQVYRSQ